MNLTSTLTAKGQTTVPKEVRRRLGLGPRQRIVYHLEEDGVRIEAAGSGLAELAGSLGDDTPCKSITEEREIYRKARAARPIKKS